MGCKKRKDFLHFLQVDKITAVDCDYISIKYILSIIISVTTTNKTIQIDVLKNQYEIKKKKFNPQKGKIK